MKTPSAEPGTPRSRTSRHALHPHPAGPPMTPPTAEPGTPPRGHSRHPRHALPRAAGAHPATPGPRTFERNTPHPGGDSTPVPTPAAGR